MKKAYLVYFLMFLFFLNSVFSFEITNNQGDENDFFSLNEPDVNIEVSNNISNFTVKYSILGTNYTKIFNFTSCSSKYCGVFSLTDLFASQNGSLTGSEQFTIVAGSNSKTISLDIKKPIIIISNSVLNTSAKKIELDFSISDDSNSIREFSLYEKNGSNEIFVVNIENKTSYDYSFKREGNLTLLFRGIDEAGNVQVEERSFIIDDFFKPSVSDISFEYRNSKFTLLFKTEDKELERYEVSQGSLSIVETISGTSIQKSVEIPFETGIISLKVYDSEENFVEQKITIPSVITLNSEKKISNKKKYSFKNDLDSCLLTKFDSQNKDNEFKKSGETFSIDLDVSENKKYNLDFKCVKGSLTQYFEKEFIYDTVSPSKSNLEIEKKDNGEIKLNWNESMDLNGGVSYRLFKDDEEIYDGKKLKYIDDEVEYPEEYEYYLVSVDSAGNSIESNKVKGIPLKVDINVDINLDFSQEVVGKEYDFVLSTDENSQVEISILNSGKIIFQKIYEGVSEVREILPLDLGENQVEVKIKDEFENQFYETYILKSVDEPLLVEENELLQENTAVIEPLKNESQTLNSQAKENGFNDYIWLFIFILVLALFIIYIKLMKTKNRYSNKGLINFDKKRGNDLVLHKTLEKIKENRAARQRERNFFNMKNKKKIQKEPSEFHKQKHMDLGNKSSIKDIDLNSQKLELRKRELDEHERAPLTKSRYVPPKKESLIDKLFLRNKKEVPKDSFSAYLIRKRNEDSWDSTKKYRESYHLELEAQRQEAQRALEEEERLKLKKLADEKADHEKKFRVAQQKEEEKKRQEANKFESSSLDDYLGKRKKRKRFYFAEMFVDRDLKNRDRK